jgi:hypothetical protein
MIRSSGLPPHPPLSRREGVKKLKSFPLPSPSRREGEHNEIRKEFPSPLRGEVLGGGDNEIFSHLPGERGNMLE